MSLSHLPLWPVPPSWYPGHMARFTRILPALLSRTDIVLELRDSRLPLTSINGRLEGALQRWRAERGHASAPPGGGGGGMTSSPPPPATCERIVVLNKRDLVPEWGMEPFRKAMKAKFPDQRVIFASWNRPRDIRALHEMLVNIARTSPLAPETNVLVIGMPNVGKSTLLNALRNIGIPGPTPKALRTSAHPGLTRALSTRLKLSETPLVYSFDSPGVMLPFLGRGDKGAERGIKLALIAGIKEGMYDIQDLAAYLLYRLNVLDPIVPAYLQLLPPSTPPTSDLLVFLDLLAQRLGILKRGGERDVARAAAWFVKWWRGEGGLVSASTTNRDVDGVAAFSVGVDGISQPRRRGWGFDFEWSVSPGEEGETGNGGGALVQRKMEECIESYLASVEKEERDGGDVSLTQMKHKVWQEKAEKRKAKQKARMGRS